MNKTINASLKAYNSFGVEAKCSEFIKVRQPRDVFAALLDCKHPIKILGGGSNVLLVDDLPYTVLRNEIKGIQVIDEDEHSTLVSVGGGEIWHNLVMWSISHGLNGLQNLSLIPGSVGAAPIQNIGAYGVEQTDCFHSLKAIHLESGTTKIFYKDDCQFAYRDSIFKRELKGQYFITHVNYLFTKSPEVNVSYGAIRQRLDEKDIKIPTLKELSDAICEIRVSKLPDPLKIGNAGSFFKNPIVNIAKYESLLEEYPGIVAYPYGEEHMKLSAGWLIDRAGWKGKELNGAKVYDNHALVLTNHNTDSGKDIWSLAEAIMLSIQETFHVALEPEVNIWGK